MSCKCLSIQSHVVEGYVGNKCAVFPLQLLGFDVSPLNSVQLSNHTQYPHWSGSVFTGEDFEKVAEALQKNDLLRGYSHILTGYMRSPSFVHAVAAMVKSIKEANPEAFYLCDPVLGDNGKLYVPEELVAIYRDEVVPRATVVTPNQFECETLSGVTITDQQTTRDAVERIHARGTQTVVITSVDRGDMLSIIVSTPWANVADSEDIWGRTAAAREGKTEGRDASHAVFSIVFPKLPSSFTGTGDLTAALLLAQMQRSPRDYVSAVERALGTVQAVCRRTIAEAPKHNELRIIQSKAEIEHPNVEFKAQPGVH